LRLPALLAWRVPSDKSLRSTLKHVDLSDAALDQLDVREFIGVEHLAMAGNRLPTLARVVGLQDLERLRTLNVARNLLTSVDELARLLAFTSLLAIGVVGNPLCDTKHWRAKLIGQLPQLVPIDCYDMRVCLISPID
jgi:Leucine-rich repeat (LRR) protein